MIKSRGRPLGNKIDDKILSDMVLSGFSDRDIAKKMNVLENSISYRRYRLGLMRDRKGVYSPDIEYCSKKNSDKNLMAGVFYEDDPEAVKKEGRDRTPSYVSFLNTMVEPVQITPINRNNIDRQ